MTCKHDERFKGVMFVHGGCLACAYEYERELVERLMGENERLRIKIGKEEMTEGDYAHICITEATLEDISSKAWHVVMDSLLHIGEHGDYYEVPVEAIHELEHELKRDRP